MQVPISDHDRELSKEPPIASQLPVSFEGKATWSVFTGHCAKCNGAILPKLLRGRVTQPIPTVYQLEAVGACMSCKLLTRFHYRFHSDGRLTWLNRNGKWCGWTPKSNRRSLFAPLQQLLRFFKF